MPQNDIFIRKLGLWVVVRENAWRPGAVTALDVARLAQVCGDYTVKDASFVVHCGESVLFKDYIVNGVS